MAVSSLSRIMLVVLRRLESNEDILWLYYGDNLDMATIAKMLDYSSPDSVKTTKSRCMSKLKARFMKIKEDFYD